MSMNILQTSRFQWLHSIVSVASFVACTLCTCMLFTCNTNISAQDSHESLLDETVIGYLHVDLQKIDAEKTTGLFASLFGKDSRIGNQFLMSEDFFSQIIDTLKEAGGRRLYFHLSLSDIPVNGPIGWLQLEAGADSTKAAEAIEQVFAMAGFKAVPRESAVLFGTESLLKRLAVNPLPLRADAAEYLELDDDTELSIVLVPSSDHHKVLSEFFDTMPAPFQSVTGTMFADGARHTVLKVAAVDEQKLELRFTGKDPQSASQLKTALDKMLQSKPSIDGIISMPEEFKLLINGILQAVADADQSSGGNSFSYSYSESTGSLDRLTKTLAPVISQVEFAAQKTNMANRIRKLILACHNFHDANKSLPASSLNDDEGRPLLSWRVSILPFIGQSKLYEQFKLDEPWDSEHNIKLVSQMPGDFVSDPSLIQQGKTTFLMVVGDQAIGRSTEPYSLENVKDGTSRTIMFVKAAPESAVEWTKPADWEFDPENPLRGLAVTGQTQLLTAFADGSSHYISFDEKKIKAACTVAGGEFVEFK